jgi:hypothetical protein
MIQGYFGKKGEMFLDDLLKVMVGIIDGDEI